MSEVNHPQGLSNPDHAAKLAEERSGHTRSLIEGHIKNLDLMSEAMRVSVQSANAIFQCHQEIIRNTLEQAAIVTHDQANARPAESAATHRELLRKTFQAGMPSARDLTEMSESLNREVVAAVRRRVAERVEESRQAPEGPNPPKK